MSREPMPSQEVGSGLVLSLAGKVAVVTGAGQGIGRAISYTLAKAGAAVGVLDRDGEAAQECVEEIEAQGGRAVAWVVDVADPEGLRRAIDDTAEHFGGLHILVNNAGIGAGGTLEELEVAAWERVLAVNLRAAFLAAKYAAPHMRRAGGGAIVNIASTRALMSEPHTYPYSASKAGLLGLTHSLAVSLGPDGIRVNAISPGWIETSAWRKRSQRREPQLRPIDHAQHPVGRVGRPEDIAWACAFLVSDQAGFITGQNLVVDGGMTVKMIYVE